MKRDSARARQLRKRETPEEQLLWRWLRDRRLRGFKFRRQHPEPPYFLDFGCVSLFLAIELDGAGHQAKTDYDAARDAYLRKLGWTVLRFGNDDVVLRLHAVLETIVREMERLSPHPDPLPCRGEGEN